MRVQRRSRTVVTAIVFAFVAAVALSVCGGADDARAAGKARLRMVDIHPVTVSGRKFRVGERVRVRLAAGGLRRTRRVTAGRSGRFVVSFRSVAVNLCDGVVTVFAWGSDGSRARLKLPVLKCPPARTTVARRRAKP